MTEEQKRVLTEIISSYFLTTTIHPTITDIVSAYDHYLTKNSGKSLANTDSNPTKSNVSDLAVWGKGDMFKLISKASSQEEGWMKSTKAMYIEGVGCMVQVSTQHGDQVAEALSFVPNVKIHTIRNLDGDVIERELVDIDSTITDE